MPHSSSASVVVRAPRAKVWEAITQPEQVKQYFFGTNLVTDWSIGSSVFFRGEWEGTAYEDRGTVLAFESMKHLAFDYWSSFSGLEDRPDLRQIVRYDLEEAPEGVRLTIRQSNVDTQERADHSAQNWQTVLEGLKSLVEGTTTT